MALHTKILIALVLGIVYSFVSSSLGFNDFTINWINPFGQIFIRMLKFIAVPLVLFSIVSGVSSLSDINSLGRLGIKTLLLYLMTTVFAISTGLLLVNSFSPGKNLEESSRVKNRIEYEFWLQSEGIGAPVDGQSFINDPQYQSVVTEVSHSFNNKNTLLKSKVGTRMESAEKQKNKGPLSFLVEMVPENIILSVSNNKLMLQVIFFALFFGVTLALLPKEQSKPLVDLIESLNHAFIFMVEKVMKAAPFFVFCLLSGVIAKMADTPAEVLEIFKGLGHYGLTVVIGLGFLLFVLYPLIVKIVTKDIGYKSFFQKLSPAQFLAFSTSSSAATLPVTMECLEDRVGVSNRVSSFVLPIGATVNMDGTSLYQAVAVVFLAQLHMIDLSLAQQLTIVLTTTLSSIGAAAVPSAGLVTMIIVLQSVGLNPAWVAIVFPIDRVLDMCRTVINVTGDALVATVVAKTEGESLKPRPDFNE